MRPPLSRGLASAASLVLAAALGTAFVSCAGAPQPRPAAQAPAAAAAGPPAASSPSTTSVGDTAAAGSDGTAIQRPAPPAMSKAQADRRAVEAALVFGSPSSFAKAFDLISSSALEPADARLLAWVGARMASILYPLRSSTFVPPDLRGQGGIPTGPLAPMISEALSGRVSDIPSGLAGDPLAELIPALALFRSDSRETARLAMAALDRFATLGYPSALPFLARGLDGERQGRLDESLGAYRSAIGLAADAWTAYLGGGRDLVALGRPAEALDLFRAVPSDILDDADFRRVRALALFDNASFDEAGPLVAQALAEDPLDARLTLIRAQLLVRAKQWQQAIPLLDAFATVDSADRGLILLRGQVAEGLRNRDEALRWAKKGLETFPDDPEFLDLAARLLLSPPAQSQATGARSAELAEARGDARRAFELSDPARAVPAGLGPARLAGRNDAGNDAARLLLEDAASRYDWASAVQYIDRARRAPGFANESLVALVLRKSGDWARALDQATVWYRANPGSEAAAEAYLRALVGSGNKKAAEDLLPRLLLGPGSSLGRSNLHYLQSLLAKSEEAALSSLRTALVENADNVDALLGVYDIYYRRQDWQRAAFYLKQALALSPRDPEITQRARELLAAAPNSLGPNSGGLLPAAPAPALPGPATGQAGTVTAAQP